MSGEITEQHVGDHSKYFVPKSAKEVLHINHVGWVQEGLRTSCRANASGCVGSKPSFYYLVGQL